jgi:hypothetical protein
VHLVGEFVAHQPVREQEVAALGRQAAVERRSSLPVVEAAELAAVAILADRADAVPAAQAILERRTTGPSSSASASVSAERSIAST